MIVTQAPYKYIQGPGAVDELGEQVKKIGSHVLVLASKTPMALLRDKVAESFARAGVSADYLLFAGEITKAERDRIADFARTGATPVDAIVGMGGGKTLDAAKAAAFLVGVPVVTVPTIASNDAPCSALSVIYSDEGHVVDVEFYTHNPALVVADSEVIANAPVRMLRAGIGDALATYIEARVCTENHYNNCLGGGISNAAFALARVCYDLLLQNGEAAVRAVEHKQVDAALENVIEANSYLSSLGFESGGLSCAHSIQDAFTTIPECHDNTLHGERVAFGTLCLLALENRTDELDTVLDFCIKVGLPVTFEQLCVTENAEQKIKDFMDVACTVEPNVYHMPPGTTPDKLYAAILKADELGRKALG